MISHENHARRYMMGADAPYPMKIGAAAPAGAFAAASIPFFPGNRTCPPCPVRGPEAGSPPNTRYLQEFYCSGVNRICPFLFLQSRCCKKERYLVDHLPTGRTKSRTINGSHERMYIAPVFHPACQDRFLKCTAPLTRKTRMLPLPGQSAPVLFDKSGPRSPSHPPSGASQKCTGC